MKPEAYNPVRGYLLVMKNFASQDPRSYSLYFDLNICFRARKVIGTWRNGPQERSTNDYSCHSVF